MRQVTARFVLIEAWARQCQLYGMIIRAPIANAVLFSVVLTAIAVLGALVIRG